MGIVGRLIALARRTPYFHLHHKDGTVYMERYWLMPRFLLREVSETDRDCSTGKHFKPLSWLPFAIRLHKICTIDFDRDMHNHPWAFISLVLRGGYVELRPRLKVPTFVPHKDIDTGVKTWREPAYATFRMPGSWAIRRASDRHLIVSVLFNTWTLVIQFRKTRDWGFFTPRGFVPWQEYDGGKM